MDPKFSNSESEWSTKRRGVTVLVGLLVKVEGLEDSVQTPALAQVVSMEPSQPQGVYLM